MRITIEVVIFLLLAVLTIDGSFGNDPPLRKPLIGLEILKFEAEGTNFSDKELQIAKQNYETVVTEVVAEIKQSKITIIHDRGSLIKVADLALFHLSKRFWVQINPYVMLAGLREPKKGDKFGFVDCDPIAIFIADVAAQFEVKAKFVLVGRHLLVHLFYNEEISIYQETVLSYYQGRRSFNDGYSPKFYRNAEEVENSYGKIYGESEFVAKNPVSYLARGHTKRNVESAIEDFNAALEFNPNNPDVHASLAGAYLKLDNCDKAIEHLNIAIQINPKDPVAFSNRAAVFNLNGNLDQARKDVNQSLKLDPERAETFVLRGKINEHAEKWRLAASDYETAIEKGSKGADTFFRCGAAWYKHAQQIDLSDFAYTQAEIRLTSAIDRNNASPDYYLLRSQIRQNMKKFVEAGKDRAIAKQLQDTQASQLTSNK